MSIKMPLMAIDYLYLFIFKSNILNLIYRSIISFIFKNVIEIPSEMQIIISNDL